MGWFNFLKIPAAPVTPEMRAMRIARAKQKARARRLAALGERSFNVFGQKIRTSRFRWLAVLIFPISLAMFAPLLIKYRGSGDQNKTIEAQRQLQYAKMRLAEEKKLQEMYNPRR